MNNYLLGKLKTAFPSLTIEMNRDASVKAWEFLVWSKDECLRALYLHDGATKSQIDHDFAPIILSIKEQIAN